VFLFRQEKHSPNKKKRKGIHTILNGPGPRGKKRGSGIGSEISSEGGAVGGRPRGFTEDSMFCITMACLKMGFPRRRVDGGEEEQKLLGGILDNGEQKEVRETK